MWVRSISSDNLISKKGSTSDWRQFAFLASNTCVVPRPSGPHIFSSYFIQASTARTFPSHTFQIWFISWSNRHKQIIFFLFATNIFTVHTSHLIFPCRDNLFHQRMALWTRGKIFTNRSVNMTLIDHKSKRKQREEIFFRMNSEIIS